MRRKTRRNTKKSNKKRVSIKRGGIKDKTMRQTSAFKTINPVKYAIPKSTKKINIVPKLDTKGDDKIHIYLNLLIDLMGSSMYDAFIDDINNKNRLNIVLKPCDNVKLESVEHVKNDTTPAIFYVKGTKGTHFICTYDKKFEMCKNKINQQIVLSTRNASITTPCIQFKNCLWDPYESGDNICTIYAGFQKSQAHSFCQTFTLSCMLNQYLPNLELIGDFKNMRVVNKNSDQNSKNNILIMNAFYAKNIACKIVKYAFNNNLSINNDDFWDFLYDQIENNYTTIPELDNTNYINFINNFLSFCENITYDEFKSSSFIDNVVY